MEKVRLIRAGSLRFVLPAGLGETVIADDVGEDEIRARAAPACGVAVARESSCDLISAIVTTTAATDFSPRSAALLDAAAEVIPGGVNTCRRRSEPRLCFARGARAPTCGTSTGGATSTTTPPTARSSSATRTRPSTDRVAAAIARRACSSASA